MTGAEVVMAWSGYYVSMKVPVVEMDRQRTWTFVYDREMDVGSGIMLQLLDDFATKTGVSADRPPL